MLAAGTSFASRLGAGAIARSAGRRALGSTRPGQPLCARMMSSTSASTSAKLPPSSTATAAVLGLVGGAALYVALASGSRLEMEGRPGFAERLKNRTKPAPAAKTEESAKADKSKAPASESADEVEASQGTGAFASSLSGTEAAPEAAEVVLEEGEPSSNQAAYNPETGEINWDCPCLGGMAHGSCGEEFKAAFSCFVYSEKEPKGIECVDRFKAMQDCFRKHPEEYAEEIADDERAAAEEEAEDPEASAPSSKKDEQASSGSDKPKSKSKSTGK